MAMWIPIDVLIPALGALLFLFAIPITYAWDLRFRANGYRALWLSSETLLEEKEHEINSLRPKRDKHGRFTR